MVFREYQKWWWRGTHPLVRHWSLDWFYITPLVVLFCLPDDARPSLLRKPAPSVSVLGQIPELHFTTIHHLYHALLHYLYWCWHCALSYQGRLPICYRLDSDNSASSVCTSNACNLWTCDSECVFSAEEDKRSFWEESYVAESGSWESFARCRQGGFARFKGLSDAHRVIIVQLH